MSLPLAYMERIVRSTGSIWSGFLSIQSYLTYHDHGLGSYKRAAPHGKDIVLEVLSESRAECEKQHPIDCTQWTQCHHYL